MAMETQPTYEDVNLILRLFELRREEKMRQARAWFAKSFKISKPEEYNTLCPPGSEQDAYFRMIVSYWEMVASFVTSGVLHQELFFQSGGELLFVWERISELVPWWREGFKNPNLARNHEMVAKNYADWMDKNSPGAYAAFQARVRGM